MPGCEESCFALDRLCMVNCVNGQYGMPLELPSLVKSRVSLFFYGPRRD